MLGLTSETHENGTSYYCSNSSNYPRKDSNLSRQILLKLCFRNNQSDSLRFPEKLNDEHTWMDGAHENKSFSLFIIYI